MGNNIKQNLKEGERESTMNNYRMIDLETWPRREHYFYYTENLKIEFHMTVPIEVTNLLGYCHSHRYKFYPTIIYLVTKVLNKIENFRMFRDANGALCVWDKIIPNYTIFHEDDKTFSDCWSDFSEDFSEFYHNILEDMEACKRIKGMKGKDHQPPNFYCISCVPWVSFSACSSRVTNGEPSFFPIITIGKYEKTAEKTQMPVNMTVAHAVCDGYHAGLFFQFLQEEINALKWSGV